MTRMTDYDNEGIAAVSQDLKAALYKGRPYTLPLTLRENGHWRQSHAGDSALRSFHHDRREQDMTDRPLRRDQEQQSWLVSCCRRLRTQDTRVSRIPAVVKPDSSQLGVAERRGEILQ
jgi:hypothetical protein